MIRRALRFGTFLAPAMEPVYSFIADRLSARLGVAGSLFVGSSYDELADADVSFVCGLAYIELCGPGRLPMTAVAAPVLQGVRYAGRPVYFSDVIVHRDSAFFSFADLRGASWCYNEPLSHSGYGITRHHLVCLGQTHGYFGRIYESGFHARSIDLVRRGEVDASAIDSHVLSLAMRHDRRLAEEIRVIDTLGPSTIQPVAVGDWLPEGLRDGIREELLRLGQDQKSRAWLDRGLIDRFAAMGDGDYDDLRQMRDRCVRAEYAVLR